MPKKKWMSVKEYQAKYGISSTQIVYNRIYMKRIKNARKRKVITFKWEIYD
jgi:hypothetical protein